jgi:hypothetical protein
MNPSVFVKNYPTPERAAAAARHHSWLGRHARPLRQPDLLAVGPTSLTFRHVSGRHAQLRDLPLLAHLMGDAHGAAWSTDLHLSALDRPHAFADDTPFPDFVSVRESALQTRLDQGHLPDRDALDELLVVTKVGAAGPAAFYKDSNPRNWLITDEGRVFVVDPDDLSLAPFGYDLAKLIVTLAMTHGALTQASVTAALTAYNRAACHYDPALATTGEELDGYLLLHTVLTAPYRGRNGYRHGANPFQHPAEGPPT